MIKNVWIALYWNSNFWSLQCTICQPISSWCCVAADDAAAVKEKYVVEAYVSIKDKMHCCSFIAMLNPFSFTSSHLEEGVVYAYRWLEKKVFGGEFESRSVIQIR